MTNSTQPTPVTGLPSYHQGRPNTAFLVRYRRRRRAHRALR